MTACRQLNRAKDMTVEPAWDQTVEGACPRGNIARCPLYIESHTGSGRGCVDDMLRPCMVGRGEMNFQKAVLKLARAGVAHPGMLEALNPIGGP